MKKNAILTLSIIGLLILPACQITPVESIAEPTKIFSTRTLAPTNTAAPQSLSPTSTFQPTPTLPATPTPSRKVTLMAVGDVMLGRTIGTLIEEEGPSAPFLYTYETLSSADITLGNLECPISTRGTAVNKTYTFRAPISAGESLALAGFDLVSLANNHILDYGTPAFEDTLAVLADNNIQPVGAGMDDTEAYAPIVIEINGLKLAFLAFLDVPTTDYDYHEWEAGQSKPGVAWAYEEKVRQAISTAKQGADIVIVLVHNGYEIVQTVSEAQQAFAHLAIDSGAALVIGSHPHVLQRIEAYQDGLIAYSMGNFVFDNFLYPPNYSAILSIVLSPEGVESYEMIDVVVQLNGVPQIMPYHIDN
jgi:poly-gamma-glutamate synthesis protein (capsule biosynthesis protein)